MNRHISSKPFNPPIGALCLNSKLYVVVAITTAMICKCSNRKHIKKINNELNALRKMVMDNESEIKRLKA